MVCSPLVVGNRLGRAPSTPISLHIAVACWIDADDDAACRTRFTSGCVAPRARLASTCTTCSCWKPRSFERSRSICCHIAPVPTMSPVDRTNCTTTRPCTRRGEPVRSDRPRSTVTGLKRDSATAGYAPAAHPTTTSNPRSTAIISGCRRDAADKLLPTSPLNTGSAIRARPRPSTRAAPHSSNASPQNCAMICPRPAPIVFRTPISCARPAERPLASVTKLMHAMRRMKAAIPPRMYAYSGRLGDTSWPYTSGVRWMSVNGSSSSDIRCAFASGTCRSTMSGS